MYRYFLALRYLLTRPINLLGILGVMLGVWALIVVVSIFSGVLNEVKSHVHSTSSDLIVSMREDGVSYESLQKIILADANVAACAPRLIWQALIHPQGQGQKTMRISTTAGADNQPFLSVLGIDPKQEMETTGLRQWIANVQQTELDLQSDQKWILLSQRRMQAFGLKPGDLISLTTACADNQQEEGSRILKTTNLRIAGAFETQHTRFDDQNAFVAIDQLRKILGTPPQQVDEVAVKLKTTANDHDKNTQERLQKRLIAAPPFNFSNYPPRVYHWSERDDYFFRAVDHQRSLMKLVLFVIMVVAGFLVYATLSMMVTEKVRDIGILTAMGGTRRGVMQVFLSCGFAISLIGVALGIISGCISAYYLDAFNNLMIAWFDLNLFPTHVYNIPKVPYHLDPLWISLVGVSALSLGLLVSGIPALRAARHDPLVSLRNE